MASGRRKLLQTCNVRSARGNTYTPGTYTLLFSRVVGLHDHINTRVLTNTQRSAFKAQGLGLAVQNSQTICGRDATISQALAVRGTSMVKD